MFIFVEQTNKSSIVYETASRHSCSLSWNQVEVKFLWLQQSVSNTIRFHCLFSLNVFALHDASKSLLSIVEAREKKYGKINFSFEEKCSENENDTRKMFAWDSKLFQFWFYRMKRKEKKKNEHKGESGLGRKSRWKVYFSSNFDAYNVKCASNFGFLCGSFYFL